MARAAAALSIDWLNGWVLAGVHGVALTALIYYLIAPPPGATLALAFGWYWMSGLSITAGYHRLYGHRAYRCSRGVAVLYLLFGAAALQNSVLRWTSDHRRHHADTDGDNDPYNARRGFWWSHIGWVLHRNGPSDYSNVRDLLADPLVRYQHRFYAPIAVVMTGLVPALIASSWGDATGGVLWAGFIRLVAQYHSTFAVNSFAHRFGRRPYSSTTSARDNIFVALVAMGEGYHNFHHQFPSDYRNGVRAFDYDPTKWLVRALARLGWASDLKRAPADAIRRARTSTTR